MGETTRVQRCNCAHKFQDELYGKGKRLFNEKKDGSWRCTVCGEDRAK